MPCQNIVWWEKISELFCSSNIVPLDCMSLEEQINSLTRLVLIIFFILLLIDIYNALIFLSISLLFIIILYYIKKKTMTHVEPFSNHNFAMQQLLKSPETYRFCNDQVAISPNNPPPLSVNQKLVGPPNPRTKIAPVVIPPSHDLDYWRANALVTYSQTNVETQEDVYQSGFNVSTCCGNMDNKYLVPIENKRYNIPIQQQEIIEPFDYKFPYSSSKGLENKIPDWALLRPNYPGEVNTACGYNPSQLYTANLPTNLPAGNCQQDPHMAEYNKNLFTQTIQPDVYTYSEVNQPINSNIGISYQQQFLPTTCDRNQDGSITYTEHDPRLIEPKVDIIDDNVFNEVNNSNVYDPRFYGYGTSYRSYIDNVTGQPRFMYDDINAIRQPNYITRNNIDFTPYADSYGPLPAGGAQGNQYNSSIRALANDTFLRASLQQRNDLQERLMRKVNSERWQTRQAPHSTKQCMAGSMSCH